MLPIAGVAGLADALVGLGGVLADGVDVAAVGALHALVDICRGEAGGAMGGAGGALPVSPLEPSSEARKPSSPPASQPAHERQRLKGAMLLLCSLVASPHPALTQWVMVSGWVLERHVLPTSTACVPALVQATLRVPNPLACLMIGNTAQAPVAQAGASPGRGESLCLQLAIS